MQLGSDQQHYWSVILARGEGVRLKSLTRFVSGEDTPIQFCRQDGDSIDCTLCTTSAMKQGTFTASMHKLQSSEWTVEHWP
jgi:hypothetical protein